VVKVAKFGSDYSVIELLYKNFFLIEITLIPINPKPRSIHVS